MIVAILLQHQPGLEKTLIPACPLDKQLSNFAGPGQLPAC